MKVAGSVAYGKTEFSYTAVYRERRTLEIAVHPDGRIVVTAPIGTSKEAIEAKVAKRARWILRQLIRFRRYEPGEAPRQYIGGETHRYLGRQYRLKIRKSSAEAVKLKGSYLLVHTVYPADRAKVKELVGVWYREHARSVLSRRFDYCCERIIWLKEPPKLRISPMKRRWGSCSSTGSITLNPELVKFSTSCIDYVIIHELCHLKHRLHDKAFYKLLSRMLPDWEKKKQRLERSLS